MLEVPLVVEHNTAIHAWLVCALERAPAQSQSKAVAYLEAVADDVVFEMEAKARRRRYTQNHNIQSLF